MNNQTSISFNNYSSILIFKGNEDNLDERGHIKQLRIPAIEDSAKEAATKI